MKSIRSFLVFLLALIGSIAFTACDPSIKTDLLPVITTTEVSAITQTSVTSGGNITSDAGSGVTVRGVCWSTKASPTIADSKTTDGAGTGSFTSSITGLTSGTTYFVRAYATNSAGTGYGVAYQITTIIVTDADGNVYHTVTIGTQVWMVENLKTNRYNDGTPIPLVTDNTEWAALSTQAYCFYNNDATTYKHTYGALYNWYAVNTGKLAPAGWHVPTDAEWTTLENYVNANPGTSGSEAKALAATTNWNYSNFAGAIGYDLTKNNSSGFSALPGGWRIRSGEFGNLTINGFWWSSTGYDTDSAWIRYMEYDYVNGSMIRYGNYGQEGYSVRCIRD